MFIVSESVPINLVYLTFPSCFPLFGCAVFFFIFIGIEALLTAFRIENIGPSFISLQNVVSAHFQCYWCCSAMPKPFIRIVKLGRSDVDFAETITEHLLLFD